jgi:hypothetical protein
VFTPASAPLASGDHASSGNRSALETTCTNALSEATSGVTTMRSFLSRALERFDGVITQQFRQSSALSGSVFPRVRLGFPQSHRSSVQEYFGDALQRSAHCNSAFD